MKPDYLLKTMHTGLVDIQDNSRQKGGKSVSANTPELFQPGCVVHGFLVWIRRLELVGANRRIGASFKAV